MNIALDYETFWSKEYSIRDLGNYAYTHDPRFEAHLLTAAYEDGRTWVGNPKDFDWSSVDGESWIFANAGFDMTVTKRLQELGIVPDWVKPGKVIDVLDLTRYLGYPGNLADAVLYLLGEKMDKGPRDRSRGLHWNEMTLEFQSEFSAYAVRDSVTTLRVFMEHGHKWPAHEQELSDDTRVMCEIGVPVDSAAIQQGIERLERLLAKVRSQIPWADDPEAKALSKKEVAKECAKHKIEPPKSMAKDSDLFDEWLRQHGADLPWAKAMGRYRSINMFLKKLEAMRTRTKPDGWMSYGLKYGGAHTLRDSGDAGLNMQNLNKFAMFETEFDELLGIKDAGIQMRNMLVAPEGKIFGVADLSAIEPCVLSVFAEDWELVEKLEQGMDIYEAQARVTGAYTDPRPLKEVDSDLRQYKKVEVLSLGYGAGAEKLQSIAKRDYDLDLTFEQAEDMVRKFRARKFIPAFWRSLEGQMQKSGGEDFQIELPSGRMQRYRAVRTYGGITAVLPHKGKMMRLKLWGGTLTENVVQATSREVFMEGCLRLKHAGLPPILRVHDEAVCLLDEATAKADLARMIKLLAVRPTWMPNLPVSAAGHLCKKYVKG